MKAMFQSCKKLEYLDLSNFNTSNVKDMSRMFNRCNKIKQIKGINDFDTSNTIFMNEMFQSCSELEYLNLTNYNISKVTNKKLIFNECNKLEIIGGEKFNEVQKEKKMKHQIHLIKKIWMKKV